MAARTVPTDPALLAVLDRVLSDCSARVYALELDGPQEYRRSPLGQIVRTPIFECGQ